MEYHQIIKEDDLTNIALKLCIFSINNIKWGILYSGVGIYQTIDEKEIKKFSNLMESDSELKKIMDDIIPIKCQYKKGKPVLLSIDSEGAGKYAWDFNSFNKTILPSTQAFSILSLLKAMDFIEKENKLLAYLMQISAQNFYNFTSTYMRNENGLFTTVENKTKNSGEELKIKLLQKEAKLIDQIFMHEAYLYLYVKYLNSNECNNDLLQRYKTEKDNIFSFLYENFNQILDMLSKEISLAISSFSRCFEIDNDDENKNKYYILISLMCAELESRIKITGEVERSSLNTVPSSIITHFRSISALLEGYLITNIEKFKDAALRIYNTLFDFYDSSFCLFIEGKYSKISYSIKDISEIIKSLLLLYIITKDENILNILSNFYTFTIENTNIMSSISKRKEIFLSYEVQMPDMIPNMLEVNKAPVFVKSFRVSLKKSPPSISLSKFYNSLYAMYSSYIFLYYFYKIIKVKDEFLYSQNENKDTTIQSDIQLKDIEQTVNNY